MSPCHQKKVGDSTQSAIHYADRLDVDMVEIDRRGYGHTAMSSASNARPSEDIETHIQVSNAPSDDHAQSIFRGLKLELDLDGASYRVGLSGCDTAEALFAAISTGCSSGVRPINRVHISFEHGAAPPILALVRKGDGANASWGDFVRRFGNMRRMMGDEVEKGILEDQAT